MNHGPLIFLGILFTLALSWCGMIFAPQIQLGRQEVVNAKGQLYPPNRPGLAQQGGEVYRANGCQYCHSQQVQPNGLGADLQRGWGKRYSVAQDYLRDVPVMLGNLRIGPDLANIGLRRPDDETHTNLVWHLQHLYNPQIPSPGSMVPPYPFLFEKRRVNLANQPRQTLCHRQSVQGGTGLRNRAHAGHRALVASLFSCSPRRRCSKRRYHRNLGRAWIRMRRHGVHECRLPVASTNAVAPASTSSPK
jgi:cytochrome c oxidase cbb3-type subunit 2